MLKRTFLGSFELLVLLAVMRLGDRAYGVPIAAAIGEAAGRDVALGSVYFALEALERRGLVSSSLGERTAERGGRPKRYFQVTARGFQDVEQTRVALTRSWQGLPRTASVTA